MPSRRPAASYDHEPLASATTGGTALGLSRTPDWQDRCFADGQLEPDFWFDRSWRAIGTASDGNCHWYSRAAVCAAAVCELPR
jgi:hypothetical protein